ncbi:MAG TPA: hypothetical protein VFK57_15170 [Vicinamibacterales bacterium]|nr:hypothetical protein [Vicinamibacterales bacterium]
MQALNPMMQWEMYAPGTAIAFSAVADDSGIRVTLQRDQMPVLTGAAADTTMLLRLSQQLRAQLQGLGYASKPPAGRLSALEGGPCWGPAAPLNSSLIETLLRAAPRAAAW